MKNREKYKKTIMELARAMEEGNFCIFKKRYVLPRLYEDIARNSCNTVSCAWCNVLFWLWLDEECEEPEKPEVDWDSVPVDTLVRVRDYEYCEWNLRYFKGIDKSNPEEKYEAWSNGATSKTADDSSNHWKYCELVEDEDD
jgi:hypothetical protein